ncbi:MULTISPECIES: transcriptional regulator LeuO [Enterobacteriaceae]|uniref:Transcriptional regulator LeuO n=1 Tax=Kluyvera genomosp. 2 TaxID=2774054 RepID=A0A2T2Y4I7_9ENTR|nr:MULTISPECIES: transcriptional regulator LeuO [Enterobacteriaceae]HAT3917863.1 transcriptional regulator LeuO [Kluyvera ascorbata]PSR47440.1 transcriptional regulator LeuO [Kluyvera genomosp. 2]BBQ85517.1 transcriptional regulator LeuO [Klebsiella sp. WP3-W18-ESBL-02]BBR22515.1 transcriptional regulator LeuO [Klebsiella sp. WP3-S18-ESBL-05]BBR60591.1 transcriptional regulator LeuO [Klebsiella sp. WP4-W18-ESBL-05]
MTLESESVISAPEKPRVTANEGNKPQLRLVDLNLLTVFDAVMQEQNITRAAHMLGMSQPAVSNAVARLKVMFNDELFVRYGRGIQPTARAFQLFGSIRQALQLVQNELPGSGFEPLSSERVFNLCVCSPLDNYLTSIILNKVNEVAPHIHMVFKSSLNQNTEHQLRYQEIEFVLGYEEFRRPEFACVPLFNDEMVMVASKKHPRINGPVSEEVLYQEEHAVVSLDRYASFSQPWYDTLDKQSRIAYQGMALISVLNVVSQTHLVAIAPRRLADEFAEQIGLQVLPLPMKLNSRTCYLSWHEAAGRDKGHQWMEELLVNACRQQ